MDIQNHLINDIIITDNVTLSQFDDDVIDPFGDNDSLPFPLLTEHNGLARFTYYTNDVILPIVFYLGILGNVFNLLLLGARRLRDERRSNMERSAVLGLRALAVSDMMFCVFGALTHSINAALESDSVNEMMSDSWWVLVAHYYFEHRGAFLNVFIFTSTWLIVLVSVERFIAVCHPFTAAAIIHVHRTTIAQVIVFVLGILVNIPLFFKFTLVRLENCTTVGSICYVPILSSFYKSNTTAMKIHMLVWFTAGTFIPLSLILVCNLRMIVTLYASRHTYTGAMMTSCLTPRLTLTLNAIVVCFLLLVCPSMLLQFISFAVHGGDQASRPALAYRFALNITNLTQAVKFASNFVLYCAINRAFRDVIGGAMRGSYCGRRDISVAAATATAAVLNGGASGGSGRRFAAVAGVGSYGRFAAAAKRTSGVYVQPAVVEVALACELASMTSRIGKDRTHDHVVLPGEWNGMIHTAHPGEWNGMIHTAHPGDTVQLGECNGVYNEAVHACDLH